MNEMPKKNFPLIFGVKIEGEDEEKILVFTEEMVDEICVNFNSYCNVELCKMLTAFPDSPQMDLFKSLFMGLVSSIAFKFDLYKLMTSNDHNEFNESIMKYFEDLMEVFKKYKKGNLK